MKISSTRFSIRLISVVLCLAMMLVCLPQTILADVGEMLSSELEPSVEDEIPSAYVLGEMSGNRTEASFLPTIPIRSILKTHPANGLITTIP